MNNPDSLRPFLREQTTILISEDNVVVQNVARIVLETAGYFILTAENGEDALCISRKYSGPIHLLLSDIKMPKMDGLALREQIQIERPSTTVLLMSGETSVIPDCPFLQKPFTPDVLRKKVRELIDDPVLLRLPPDLKSDQNSA